MRNFITEAFFSPSAIGQRFFLLRRPQNPKSTKGALLHIHAFAEEMNKSRRAVSQTAQYLAGQGWWVLQHDLLGCGDSSGDFGDATWEIWLDDVAAAFEWLADRSGAMPVLWGLRVGCLLALESLDRVRVKPNALFWQPVVAGHSYLNQFLRLKVAASGIASSSGTVSTKILLQTLTEGKPVEVGGYQLSRDLAVPMGQAGARVSANRIGKILLCELAGAPGEKGLSIGLTRKVLEWREAGCQVDSESVDDLPFWQTQEIAEGSGFQSATLQLLNRLDR
ncbi:MAG: hydrolase 2, exosortase A system-associated [Burkholderiales bacterium]